MPDDNDQTQPVPEPVLTGYVVSLILAVLAGFGVDVANDTVGKVASAAAGLIVVATSAWITRSRVTPEVTAKARIEDAKAEAKAEVVADVQAAPAVAPNPVTVAPQNLTFDFTGVPAPPNDRLQQLVDGLRRLAADIDHADIDPVAPPAPPAPDPIPWAPTRVPPPPGLD